MTRRLRSCRRFAGAALGLTLFLGGIAGPSPARAATLDVTIRALNADGSIGDVIGTVRFIDRFGGVVIEPNLKGLTPGLHGFHVHQNPSCAASRKNGKLVPGGAAGGHYDPFNTGAHLGPYGKGHLGDLPSLVVGANGVATRPLFAPRVKVPDLRGRSLIIHAGGDNYSDKPKPLGGGGARVACGVIR